MLSSVIVGGGPGGTGILIWAAQNGQFSDLLSTGLAVVDRREGLGGTLGRYAVNSDSLGGVYLECLEAASTPEEIRQLSADPVAREIEAYRNGFPPLALVNRFMHRLGAKITAMLRANARCIVHSGTEARALHIRQDGTVCIETATVKGGRSFITALSAVLALGGRQQWQHQILPHGLTLSDYRLRHVITSDRLLSHEGMHEAARALRLDCGRPLVILGGSHSAYSAAWALTRLLPAGVLGARQITILQRSPPSVFYPGRAAAEADEYPVTEGSICSRTQRVNRLGGLRGNGRDIWRGIHRRTGAEPEPQVSSGLLADHSAGDLRNILEEAALVVPAFGYSARTIPIFDPQGRRLILRADSGHPAVDQDCQLLLNDGTALAGVFGMGLGSGYRPSGMMGGEANFSGQANSLWLYQNDIGAIIYRGIQGRLSALGKASSRRKTAKRDLMKALMNLPRLSTAYSGS